MPKFEQAKLRRQDVLVLKNTRTGQIEKVVFPNGIEVGLPQTGFNAGIRLPNISEGPSNTTEKLYVVDGVLYYDGNPLVGSNLFPNGLSGSLTQLVDGTSYLVAGTNITITSQSNGPITISSSGGGGAPTNAQYVTLTTDATLTDERVLLAGTGINSVDGGAGNNITLNIDDSVVATVSGTIFTGATSHQVGLSGSLTQLTDGTSYLVAGTNITITSQSNGPITISSSGGGGGSPGGSDTQVQFNDGGSFGGDSDFSWNKTTNNLTVSGTIELLTASFKSTAFAGTVNLQAPFDLATDLTFTLPEADGTKFQTLQTDSAGNLSFDYADRIYFNVRNESGVELPAGTPVYVTGYSAGNDRSIIAASSASLASTMPAAGVLAQTLSNNTNGKAVSAGVLEGVDTSTFTAGDTLYVASGGGLQNTRPTGFTDGIQNIALVLESAVNGTLKVRSPGRTNDTPNIVTATGGLSGSLTRLTDGTSYLIAGSNITITSSSNGPVTIASSGGGAPTNAQYVTLATDATLSDERVLTAGTGISIVDGGAGSAVTISSTGGGSIDPTEENVRIAAQVFG